MYRFHVLIFLLLFCGNVFSQIQSLNVHHLTTRDGLGDGVVRAIGQDKYGYIWIGTASGLSRFDGTNIRRFQSDPRSKGSPPPSVARVIYNDSRNVLWFGFSTGLYQFNYETQLFSPVKETDQLSIFRIHEDIDRSSLYLLTDKGIALYEITGKRLTWIARNNHEKYIDLASGRRGVYALTSSSLFYLKWGDHSLSQINKKLVPETDMYKLAIDHQQNIWISFNGNNGNVRKIDEDLNDSKLLLMMDSLAVKEHNNFIRNIFVDNKGSVWFLNSILGLACFDQEKQKFHYYKYQEGKPNSLSPIHAYDIFQSRNGEFWVGTEGYGVDFFDPGKTLFKVISSMEDRRVPPNSTWARAAVEDNDGNLWMSWVGGLFKYDRKADKYTAYENYYSRKKNLYHNSVRALLADSEGFLWVGTARGMNRINIATGKVAFMDLRDSLPPDGFYWSVNEDHQKNIWIGTGERLFFRKADDGKIYSSYSHPLLAPVIDTGVRVIYQDSRNCIWFGLNGKGLVMLDPVRNKVRKWKNTSAADSTLLGNTITAIHEDKTGIVWISSFNGLVGYRRDVDRFIQFTHVQQLPSLKCSGLLTDSANRLWIGTTSGLTLLDPARKHFTTFTMEDGLPTLEFSDMPATRLRNGKFLFPTMLGFVEFDPMGYSTRQDTLSHYISSIKIFDKNHKANTNTEALRHLALQPNENFFSFQLVALNYHNPVRTWYAYKLEGFDKDWIISNSGIAHYTNVPGGNYTFRYKASVDPEQWDVPEKQLSLYISTYFYNTRWFYLLVACLAITILYSWYRTRIRRQQNLYMLQSKAQLLEKEKALVKFEGLKQQLNPHFLFNSLSSLGSLIRTNNEMAISFLDKLSKTYRYILQSRDMDLIPIEYELRFARSYISLQETRFNLGLKIDIDIPAEKISKKVVPVILQNLVDNAIKHNTIDSEKPLHLKIYIDGEYLVVRNNIQRKKLVETSNKQGLNNLISLYRYLTDKPMLIEETPHFFTVKIPLL